jgi:putative tricarboxylic transport membrane protein
MLLGNDQSRGKEQMKRAWQITCMAFLALAILTLVLSFDYPYLDKLGPGPAFFARWISIISGALSLALFFQTTWGKSVLDTTVTLLPERQGVWRIMITLVALLGCLVLLNPLGFRISLFLFLLFLPPMLGERNYLVTLIFALVGSFGVFHAFYYWLKVPLPIGVLGI